LRVFSVSVFGREIIHKKPESVNAKVTFRPISRLMFSISVRFHIGASYQFSFVNSDSLASVTESCRDMVGSRNMRSFFLAAASTTANLMDVDPGIDENTSRPSFRVSEGS
jgi:hypothetical protein